MCDDCTGRARRLRDLADRFERMADETRDEQMRPRLKHAAIDLGLIAGDIGGPCDGSCGDIVWEERLVPGP